MLFSDYAYSLSEFEKYRSYPYLDRAYKATKSQNWAEVERLMRHLLSIVPQQTQARVMLVNSLAKQQRYADALNELPNTPTNQTRRLNLRLSWIQKHLPESKVVNDWIKTGAEEDKPLLWRSYALALSRYRTSATALTWLQQLARVEHSNQLHKDLATWAEKLHKNQIVINQLTPLLLTGNLDSVSWRRLANAYVTQLDENSLKKLLTSAPEAKDALYYQRAMIGRAIALRHTKLAQHWLEALPKNAVTQSDKVTLWELAQQNDDVVLLQKISHQLGRPCLETTEWLSQHHPIAAAEQLQQCKISSSNAHKWLILAQKIHAIALIEKTRLPAPWEEQRYKYLLTLWNKLNQNDHALAWLKRQPVSAELIKQQAIVLQRVHQLDAAAVAWKQHYQKTGEVESLNQASFLWLETKHINKARKILDEAFDLHRSPLPAHILERMAELYLQIPTLSPLQSKRYIALTLQVDRNTRANLLNNLVAKKDCALLQRVIPEQPNEREQFNALAHCAMPAQPGIATIYYQSAGDSTNYQEMMDRAYALEASGDSAAALQLWKNIPIHQIPSQNLVAASRTALHANDISTAEQYWQYTKAKTAEQWALGASIAQAQEDFQRAMQRQFKTLRHNPNAEHFYMASITADRVQQSKLSLQWLAKAVHRAPDNARYRAEYGMHLASIINTPNCTRAVTHLEYASAVYQEDYHLGETLAQCYAQLNDNKAAGKELRRILDIESDIPMLQEDEISIDARRYRQKRSHEALFRRNSWTFATTWSPGGVTTSGNNLNQTGRRQANSRNLLIAVWDHAIGKEASHAGRTLSIYGRALAGNNDGSSRYGQSLSAGLGVRYKPFGQTNINFYSEIYQTRQFDKGRQLDRLWDSSHGWHHGETSTDYLLRTTASFLDQGKYRNDWRVDESHWHERSLYLDASWWIKEDDLQWLTRYQQGHTWKLPLPSAQTVMGYGLLEFSARDPEHVWRQDTRTGIGLRWQWWFNDSQYDAYRSRLSIRSEYQYSLGGNLYQKNSGILLGIELSL